MERPRLKRKEQKRAQGRARAKRRQRSSQELRRIFLLGTGIQKSISPIIHNKVFKEVGYNATYSLIDVDESKFDSTILKIRLAKDVVGLNVTAPFKEKIIPHLSALDAAAEAVGAVNTVKIDSQGTMQGFNTDIDGVTASLSKLGLIDSRKDKKALVLGAGGAARACVYALIKRGFSTVIILNRTLSRAEAVVNHFRVVFPRVNFKTAVLNETNFSSAVADTDIAINAVSDSPEGRFQIRFDFSNSKKGMKALDLGYKEPSLFFKTAQSNGIVSIDGSLMLVEQAAKSFEIWTGISAPRKTMMLAARRALKARAAKS